MKNLILFFFVSFLSIQLFSQCENDSINPYFIDFQSEVTISCSDDINSIFPIAMDNCDDSVEIAVYEESLNYYCPGTYDLFRIYRAFDNLGNNSVESQIIHIVDETPPSISQLSPLLINCTDPIIFDVPNVTDNCSNYLLTYQEIVDDSDSCNVVHNRVWTAQDV